MLYIVFIIASLVTLGAALMVVTGKNIFHNALFMVLSFIGVATLYILLEAEFLRSCRCSFTWARLLS